MVNTRTDADLSAAVQNALQTLLPQIRAEIREEFRTSAGPSNAGGNPPPDAFKTRLAVYKFEGMHLLGGKPISKPKERLKREYHSIRQTNTETSTEFMQRFLRLAGFLGAAAGTEEEQAKNFQWGLRRSTQIISCVCRIRMWLRLPMLLATMRSSMRGMTMTLSDQTNANAARNYEILYERDDDDTERPDKRQKSGDRHQPTSQQSSHRNHGHNNDRHGSDKRSGGNNHRSNNNYSGSNN
nr:hypothetical protein [Tanacetum cinerariifolium]